MGPGNRPLDLEWLEDFLALAATGNFSRAAQSRTIAQPAFSRHIRALEEWVGVDLVDRTVHPAELTAAGKRLLPLVQDVTAALEAARIKARAAHDEAEASLRFAVTHVLSLHFFPVWLGKIEQAVRFGPVQTMSDSYQACEDLMLQRRVQFTICYGDSQHPGRLDEDGYPMVELGQDVLLSVSAPDPQQPMNPMHSLTAQTGSLAVLSYGDSSALGRILQTHRHLGSDVVRCNSASRTAKVVFTAHNASLLRSMVLAGRGAAWLPKTLVERDLAQGILVPAGADDWNIPISIRLYRQRHEMAAVAESLWRTCIDLAKEI